MHWTSSFSLCNPCEVKYKYIAKLETTNQDFGKILNAVKGAQMYYPNKTLGPNTIGREDPKEKVKRYYSHIDPRIIARLKELFAADFELLGYDYDFDKV